MRIFVALDIDDAVRRRIGRFLDGVREFAPDARWVRSESLHVTLKFIGERSEADVDKIKGALAEISAEAFEIAFRGHGFFPSMRSPRVFWIGSEGGAKLTALAANVDETLARLDIPKEEHAFNAHLTLARGGGGRSGSPRGRRGDREKLGFQGLQEKLTALPVPEFGTMTAREFFLYQSQLGRGGSKYTKLAKFALH